ncbi:hypothetical protein VTK56DRAFT_2865 [Thermocarpiscus australiensis]
MRPSNWSAVPVRKKRAATSEAVQGVSLSSNGIWYFQACRTAGLQTESTALGSCISRLPACREPSIHSKTTAVVRCSNIEAVQTFNFWKRLSLQLNSRPIYGTWWYRSAAVRATEGVPKRQSSSRQVTPRLIPRAVSSPSTQGTRKRSGNVYFNRKLCFFLASLLFTLPRHSATCCSFRMQHLKQTHAMPMQPDTPTCFQGTRRTRFWR